MHIFGAILIVSGWIVAAILLLFLSLIGRFYEIRFGQRSYFQFMLIPLVLFVAASIWYVAFAHGLTGDPLLDFVGALLPDMLLFVGGAILMPLSYYLFRTMTGGRR